MDASTIVTLAQIASSTLITMCAIIFGKNKNLIEKYNNKLKTKNDDSNTVKKIMIREDHTDEINAN